MCAIVRVGTAKWVLINHTWQTPEDSTRELQHATEQQHWQLCSGLVRNNLNTCLPNRLKLWETTQFRTPNHSLARVTNQEFAPLMTTIVIAVYARVPASQLDTLQSIWRFPSHFLVPENLWKSEVGSNWISVTNKVITIGDLALMLFETSSIRNFPESVTETAGRASPSPRNAPKSYSRLSASSHGITSIREAKRMFQGNPSGSK